MTGDRRPHCADGLAGVALVGFLVLMLVAGLVPNVAERRGWIKNQRCAEPPCRPSGTRSHGSSPTRTPLGRHPTRSWGGPASSRTSSTDDSARGAARSKPTCSLQPRGPCLHQGHRAGRYYRRNVPASARHDVGRWTVTASCSRTVTLAWGLVVRCVTRSPRIRLAARVRAHEKSPAVGRVEVLAGGQVRSPLVAK